MQKVRNQCAGMTNRSPTSPLLLLAGQFHSDARVIYTNRQYVHDKDNLSPGARLANDRV